MTTLFDVFRPLFSKFASHPMRPSLQQDEMDTELSVSTQSQDAEQSFLASIAHLPAEEQQKQIQKRLWYARLVQRQGIMEAEHLVDKYDRTGELKHKFW